MAPALADGGAGGGERGTAVRPPTHTPQLAPPRTQTAEVLQGAEGRGTQASGASAQRP